MPDSSLGPSPLLSALIERAKFCPDQTVLASGDQCWNARQLLQDSERLAQAFLARGVQPGDRIALHMYNIAEVAIGYLACFSMGAIAMPLNARFKTAELQHWIERTKPTLYLGQAELYAGVAPIAGHLLSPDSRFVVALSDIPDGARPWSDLMAASPCWRAFVTPDPDAPAVLLGTSGTTGSSKLVVWTQRILTSLAPSAEGRGVGKGDVLPLMTPLMHGSGLYYLATALTRGATAIMIPRFDADTVLDAIERYRCTSLFGLPSMCEQLASRQRERPRDVTSLRMCTVAGDTCPAEVEHAFQIEFGKPLLSFWAATEDVGATVPRRAAGPYMRFVPGADIRIVDPEGASVAPGKTGEMLIRSPTTSPGYWKSPSEILRLQDGFFHTGDLVRDEGDLELRHMGRKKDIIIRGGSNISPSEVETVLRSHSAVRDVAVAGIADSELGQRVGALLVLEGDRSDATIRSILEAARQKIADYKLPELVAVAHQIPRNTLTKIDRKKVAEMIHRGATDMSSA